MAFSPIALITRASPHRGSANNEKPSLKKRIRYLFATDSSWERKSYINKKRII